MKEMTNRTLKTQRDKDLYNDGYGQAILDAIKLLSMKALLLGFDKEHDIKRMADRAEEEMHFRTDNPRTDLGIRPNTFNTYAEALHADPDNPHATEEKDE